MKRRVLKKNCNWMTRVVCFIWILSLTLYLAIPLSHAKTPIQMVAVSMGGNAYFWMAAASKILNEELTDYEFSVRAGTTSANILQLEKGEVPLAHASQMIFAKMYSIEALKTTRIREVWALYPMVWYLIVPKDSPAKSIYDLKGKRIACGIRTGEGALFLDYIEGLGLSEKDFKLQFIGKGEGIEAFKGGAVDAFSGGSVVPSPDFTELAASRSGARLVEISDADLEKILLKVKPLQSIGVIPAGSHAKIQKDIKTIVYGNSVHARDDVPQELVYGIARALHKRYKDLVEIFPGAKYSTAEGTAKYHVFPLHLGTQKFLKEIKIEFRP